MRAMRSARSRQRRGTAKGLVFLSIEDETGLANVILTPDLFAENRIVVRRSRFLRIEGILQNQDGVIHEKAQLVAALKIRSGQIRPHDFH